MVVVGRQRRTRDGPRHCRRFFRKQDIGVTGGGLVVVAVGFVVVAVGFVVAVGSVVVPAFSILLVS